jgi:small-conductance mechanosensitive channel
MARVKQLSDHGVDLELTVWISDPAVGEGELRSELLKEVLRTYRAEGISIPYPRREVRMIPTPETRENRIPPST